MFVGFRTFIHVLLACTCLPAAVAYARVGEAEVREGPRGGPCFTITPHEERLGTPDFQGIVVWEGAHPLWKMTMPKERTFPLTYGMCVPYGGRVASLPRTVSGPLVPGRIYSLRIEARPGGGGRTAPFYEARFCLARQHDGSAAVHQIANADRERPRMAGCLPPGD
ncbi:MAG: hypothetical protein JF619_17280 [Massilia sp.]|nr:hypothetical protein [Massilia sp.]